MTWTGVTMFTHQDAPVPVPESGQPDAGAGGVHGGSSSASSGGKGAGTFDPKLIDMDRPWDGDTPPVPLPGAGFDPKFERRPDGVWCRKRGKGMYPVDRNGEEWKTPRIHKPDGTINYDRRPPEISASFWWGSFSNVARKRYWTTLWNEKPHLKPRRLTQPDLPKPPAPIPGTPATACTAPGIYALFDGEQSEVKAWAANQSED